MTVNEFKLIIKKNPIIPCTKDLGILASQEYKRSKIIYLHDFNIFDLDKFIKICVKEKFNKCVILGLDTMQGISNDVDGINFIKKIFNISAIESSSPRVLAYSKKIGLITIQTIFTFDSRAVIKAINLIKELKPDFIDVRPGIALKKFNSIASSAINKRIICSGLINSKEEINFLFKNGAIAITTSKPEFWKLYY